MTGFATVESAVEAMKLGAYDLIQKPIDNDPPARCWSTRRSRIAG